MKFFIYVQKQSWLMQDELTFHMSHDDIIGLCLLV